MSADRCASETADGRTYKVERIVRHRGKAGAKNHQYLVKWKGWGPYHASWEPASKVNAPDLIQAYEADLQKQREYLDGVIDDIGNAQGTAETSWMLRRLTRWMRWSAG